MKDITDGVYPNFPKFKKDKYLKDRENLLKTLNTTVVKFQTKWNAMVFVESGENLQVQPIEIPRIAVNIP